VVTRRDLLVSSAAVLGALGLGTGTAGASLKPSRELAATALYQRAASGFGLPGGLFCPVPYLSRAAWGADESWRFTNGSEDWPAEHHPAQALTVHHTGFAANPDPAETVRTIYRQQALTPARGGIQGWGDIGYNLLIDAAGVVYEGRYSGSGIPIFGPERLMTTAAHVLYYNTGNIGVCLLGYLHDAPPTQAAQDSLVTVLAYLAAVVGVNPLGTVNYYNPVARPDGSHTTNTVRGVSGHRDWAGTECPGNALYPLLGGIRQRAADAMPSVSQPEPSQPEPSQSQSSGEPSPSATESPGPSTSESPGPGGGTEPTPSPTQNPPPAQGGSSSGGAPERGGDEYVAEARAASPSEFPTVAPSASPSPTSTVDDLVSAAPSSWAPSTWSASSSALAASGAGSPGWGVPATAAGVMVAGTLGSLGGLWWRHRRPAASAVIADATGPSIVEQEASPPSGVEPTVDESTTPPFKVEALTATESPVKSSVDETATGDQATDSDPAAADG
jgi:hypothetical protein